MKIKSLSKENRPRERLEKSGPEALSDAELLALIIRTGSKKENAVDVAQNLLSSNNLQSLSRASLTTLSKTKGIGKTKAGQIVACFELARRMLSGKQRKEQISGAKDVAKIFIPKLAYQKQENFIGLYLDTRRKIIKEETLFVGNLNTTLIHPREIFYHAITDGAAGIILIHNHPSGDPKPSEEDIEITKDLFKSSELLNIKLLDHVIVGDKKYFSFRERGLLQ